MLFTQQLKKTVDIHASSGLAHHALITGHVPNSIQLNSKSRIIKAFSDGALESSFKERVFTHLWYVKQSIFPGIEFQKVCHEVRSVLGNQSIVHIEAAKQHNRWQPHKSVCVSHHHRKRVKPNVRIPQRPANAGIR